MRIFQLGGAAAYAATATGDDATIAGTPVTGPLSARRSESGKPWLIPVSIGAWPSGVYVARVLAPDGSRAYAPFVLAPRVLGAARVLVVEPTNGGERAEFVSDDDLDRFVSGSQLGRLYDLIVFPRRSSAPSTQAGRRTATPTVPNQVVGALAAPWLFAGTGLHNGGRVGRFGIEIDERTAASPSDTHVLAQIPNDFGPGLPAEMTYYRDGRAQVFDAGVINFGGSADHPPISQLIDKHGRPR